jgi:hypothetical protein
MPNAAFARKGTNNIDLMVKHRRALLHDICALDEQIEKLQAVISDRGERNDSWRRLVMRRTRWQQQRKTQVRE